MAAAIIYSCSGFLGLRFSQVLLAFWYIFVGSGSALTVIQTPSFVSDSTEGKISFRCSVDDTSYRFYLYHQLAGKTELKVIGYLSTASKILEEIPPELTNRLKGDGFKFNNPSRRELRLELSKLQANDTGLYLCAAVHSERERNSGRCKTEYQEQICLLHFSTHISLLTDIPWVTLSYILVVSYLKQPLVNLCLPDAQNCPLYTRLLI
ncbi:uncharacterized protein LOC131184480 [Ahaetulla prasina]|uniref:uncharacterized protein LOC131184480 n=1 Tax=Ahaetulla prasina TaxID=499056 RepID=UPI002649D235|nr:uncharacterized protein LOC131184480 [Ahaetulla prasina]